VLQGTFETLSLPEVLGLLASARKSGALWLEAGPVAGIVHLQDGHCHAVEAGDQRDPVADGPALLTRLVDLCFAAMCQESGSFRFAADDPAPWWCAEPVELSDAVVEVDRLLKQWREILRVIPSLECRPRLLDALEVDEMIVDRERWSLLVAIDGRRTVRELVERAGRPMLDVCHVLLEFVEAGAIGVIDPAASRADVEAELDADIEADIERVEAFDDIEVPSQPAEPEPAIEPETEMVAETEPEPEFEIAALMAEEAFAPDTEPAPFAAAAPADEAQVVVAPGDPDPVPVEPAHDERGVAAASAHAGEPEQVPVPAGGEGPDRGAFLRLFSGLRDS
jgi:hypothetical protein